MSDTTKQEAVLARFMRDDGGWYSWNDLLAMADSIIKLEAAVERQDRILAALREPSKAMLHEMTETWIATPWGANHWQAALRAAVAAAEQEVEG